VFDGMYDGRDIPGASLAHPLSQSDLAKSMLWEFERAVARHLPVALGAWLASRVPLAAAPKDLNASVYRMLATDPAAVVRKCAAGDRAACRLGFALDSLPTNRIAAWYDQSDLPSLAANAGDGGQRSWMAQRTSRDEQSACIERAQLDVCRAMLSLLPADAFRIPMPAAARESLMRLTLSTGGPQAISRLRETRDSTVAGQLATAAGVPADTLIDRWVRQVIAARPSSPLPNATFALASLACIALCAAWAVRGKPWN